MLRALLDKYRLLASSSDREIIKTHMPNAVEFSGENGNCWYSDRNSSILAVCSIKPLQRRGNHRISKSGSDMFGTDLDKRISHHIALNVLPHLDMPVDVLIATRSESGKTGADYFQPSKEYQLVMGFRVSYPQSHDLGERDCRVRINPLKHAGLTRLLNSNGYPVSQYIASREIQSLGKIGCAGVQFAIQASNVSRQQGAELKIGVNKFNDIATEFASFVGKVIDSGIIVSMKSEVSEVSFVRKPLDPELAVRFTNPLLTLKAYKHKFTPPISNGRLG